jgi:hypothetical protein
VTVEDLPVAFDNLGKTVTKNGSVNVRLPLQDLSPARPDQRDLCCSSGEPVQRARPRRDHSLSDLLEHLGRVL